MKKLILAAIALFTVGASSSIFAGDHYGGGYVVQEKHCYSQPKHYVVQEPCKQVITYPVYKPCHIEKKVIIQQPVTYVKPCHQTYYVAPTYTHGCYNQPHYNYHYTPSHCW